MNVKFSIMRIAIINGPNLNLLGQRETSIYGSTNFEMYFETLKQKYADLQLSYFQSNVEGELINYMHQAQKDFDAIILNAGGYSHTSVSIGDAVKAIDIPVVEVHISNIFAREDFRHHSFVSTNAKGIIVGFGIQGYELAIMSLIY